MKLKNAFILGDCLDILPQIPDESFNLVIIDPPYNIGKEFANDNLEDEEFLALFEQWMEQISRKLKPTGSFYCFTGEYYLGPMKIIIDKYLTYQKLLIWAYGAGFHFSKKNYTQTSDFCYFYTKSQDYTFNCVRDTPKASMIKRWEKVVDAKGNIPYEKLTPYMASRYKKENYDKNPINIYRGMPMGNVIHVPRSSGGGNPEFAFGKHPTQKPEKLINILIKISSNEGDLVADFFAGMATILVCAKKLHRNYFGTEIEEGYYWPALDRLKSIPLYKSLLEKEKEVVIA